MKKILLLTLLTLIFGSSVFAQIERDITAIRAEVAAINKSAAKYSKKTKDVDGISLEGTKATYYVSGKGLKKVVAKMYGESFNAAGEFYYQGEELIFAYVKQNKYDRPIGSGGKSPKIVSTEEHRFYFTGGNLIRLLVGKKEIKPGDERYEELKSEAVGTSDELKKAY